MATATLNWSGESASESHNGTTLVRNRSQRWTVIDADEADDALNATGLPIYNQELVPGSTFRVRARTPSRIAPRTWEVTVEYAIPPAGEFTGGGDPNDPLSRPMRIRWGVRPYSKAMQVDATNRPIRNSAGVFFDPLPETEVYIETLSILRNESTYDRAKARQFRNHVNNNQFVVGNTTILPYECKCVYIGPSSEFEATATYIEIEYQFEIAGDLRADSTPNESGFPFDFHVVDQGTRGWFNDGTNNRLGFFCTYEVDSGNNYVTRVIDEPVLLDGTGKPIDTAIRVTNKPDGTGKVYTPIANPSTSERMSEDYESPFSTSSVKQWLFANLPEADFSQIFT